MAKLIRTTVFRDKRENVERSGLYRHVWFGLTTLLIGLVFYGSLKTLYSLLHGNELYSHILVIPFASGYILFLKRKEILSDVKYSIGSGGALLAAGVILYLKGQSLRSGLSENDNLSILMSSAWALWVGGFLIFYGWKAARRASFPLLFLLFIIPIPDRILEAFLSLLQSWSAEAVYVFLRITGISFLRDGFTFHLPGMSFEVAKQCSGIRSSIALVIISIFSGHLFLRTGWRKLVLVLSVFPVTVLKNGLRIVTLILLGNYVDQRILSGQLHRSGGIPFLILALAFLAPILWVLRKSEKKD